MPNALSKIIRGWVASGWVAAAGLVATTASCTLPDVKVKPPANKADVLKGMEAPNDDPDLGGVEIDAASSADSGVAGATSGSSASPARAGGSAGTIVVGSSGGRAGSRDEAAGSIASAGRDGATADAGPTNETGDDMEGPADAGTTGTSEPASRCSNQICLTVVDCWLLVADEGGNTCKYTSCENFICKE